MGVPYAEVIGDPVAHSKSPLIHKFWLGKLGMEGDYRATRVHYNDLSAFIADRRADPDWRGCNVTQPHKISVIDQLNSFTSHAVAVGAVNCVFRRGSEIIGTNTDVTGIEEVFDRNLAYPNQVTLIGAGGAARAVLEVVRRRDVLEVFMVVRDPAQARSVHRAFARSGAVHTFDEPRIALADSEYVINATPLGMRSMPAMPVSVLDGLRRVAANSTVFDMVYAPLDTELLKRARSLSLRSATGLDMLVGQARGAFECFFGVRPPHEYDDELLDMLTS